MSSELQDVSEVNISSQDAYSSMNVKNVRDYLSEYCQSHITLLWI